MYIEGNDGMVLISRYRGEWDPDKLYDMFDTFSHNDNDYICIDPCTVGVDPSAIPVPECYLELIKDNEYCIRDRFVVLVDLDIFRECNQSLLELYFKAVIIDYLYDVLECVYIYNKQSPIDFDEHNYCTRAFNIDGRFCSDSEDHDENNNTCGRIKLSAEYVNGELILCNELVIKNRSDGSEISIPTNENVVKTIAYIVPNRYLSTDNNYVPMNRRIRNCIRHNMGLLNSCGVFRYDINSSPECRDDRNKYLTEHRIKHLMEHRHLFTNMVKEWISELLDRHHNITDSIITECAEYWSYKAARRFLSKFNKIVFDTLNVHSAKQDMRLNTVNPEVIKVICNDIFDIHCIRKYPEEGTNFDGIYFEVHSPGNFRGLTFFWTPERAAIEDCGVAIGMKLYDFMLDNVRPYKYSNIDDLADELLLAYYDIQREVSQFYGIKERPMIDPKSSPSSNLSKVSMLAHIAGIETNEVNSELPRTAAIKKVIDELCGKERVSCTSRKTIIAALKK